MNPALEAKLKADRERYEEERGAQIDFDRGAGYMPLPQAEKTTREDHRHEHTRSNRNS